MQRPIALLMCAGFVSACSSTSTLRTVSCDETKICEQRAEQICHTKKYRVTKRTENRVDENAKGRREIENTGASDIGGAISAGATSGLNVHNLPRWLYEVDCKPITPTPTGKYTETVRTVYPELTAEQLAEREKNKAGYMREVCELTNPDLRREELEIARQQYGDDVSCTDIQGETR